MNRIMSLLGVILILALWGCSTNSTEPEQIISDEQAIMELLAEQHKPIVLVGHSLGCITITHWAQESRGKIQGALLVAPADVERPDTPPQIQNFRPVPLEPLPFCGIVVGSSNDPYVSLQRAEMFAKCWSCRFINIGPSGHIDTAAGFGPWRQGEVLLQQLLRL